MSDFLIHLNGRRRTNDVMQIEQFIESIFPSQNPKAIAAAHAAQAPVVPQEEAEQRAMAEEAKWDTSIPPSILLDLPEIHSLICLPVYLLALVMGFLFILSCIMVLSRPARVSDVDFANILASWESHICSAPASI